MQPDSNQKASGKAGPIQPHMKPATQIGAKNDGIEHVAIRL
jgi:hypothetical protein